MSQRSGWIVPAIAAALACAAGCLGPGVPLGDDPIRGGRPLPSTQMNNPRRADLDDPLLLPPSDAGRSPAALTNDGERNARREETPAATWRKADTPAKDAPPAVVNAGGDSYEQLQQQLQARGVTWQQLKTSGERGEWMFACAIPDPRERGVERHYEAKAAGPYGLAAIKAVLAEIEADLKQRGER